jgi:hypothetical protein
MQYNTSATGQARAAQLLPFVSNNESIFKPLGIIQMETAWIPNKDGGFFSTLFTLEKKRAKHMLVECVVDYNRWFPESEIHIMAVSCKYTQSSEEKNAENMIFGENLSALRSMPKGDGGCEPVIQKEDFNVWNRHAGWISENAWGKRRLADIVIVYSYSGDATTPPFFVQYQQNGDRMLRAWVAFGSEKRCSGVNISDLKSVHVGETFYISKMRIVSETDMGSLLKHVGKYMDRQIQQDTKASFTADIPPTMGLMIQKCGIRVPGDGEYSAALELLS